MLLDIGQRLLDDTEGRQFDLLRKAPLSPLIDQVGFAVSPVEDDGNPGPFGEFVAQIPQAGIQAQRVENIGPEIL